MRNRTMRTLIHAALLLVAVSGGLLAQKFYSDDPLIAEPEPMHVEDALYRQLADYYDFGTNMFGKIGDLRTKAGHPIPAQAVNTLGEPMESAWWRRRHYYNRMPPDELKRGVGSGSPPSTGGEWTITAAKTEGVTPGFVIQDETGTLYVLKFDPIDYPQLATGADMITSKIFHAVGYNVPEYYVVHFDADRLVVGDDVELRDSIGQKRKMTRRDVIELLLDAPRDSDGRWRAIASRWLPGKPLGPFRFYGTRTDDPNDIVPHEHRRDLRGYKVFCSWVNHDDSRAINSLDMLVEEDGVRFIRHYLIDFGSTLGSATNAPNSPRGGHEYLWDGSSTVKQLFSLGLWVPPWAKQKDPRIESVGKFEARVFDPVTWVPEYPNAAFVNALPDDNFWAAKQVMAFSGEDIRAIVEVAEYSDQRAADYVARTLIERRDKIGRAHFARVLPLDRFEIRDGKLTFEDLEMTHGFIAAREHKVRWSRFDNESKATSPIDGAVTFGIPGFSDGGYVAAEISAERPGQTVTVYVRKRGGNAEVAGIERSW